MSLIKLHLGLIHPVDVKDRPQGIHSVSLSKPPTDRRFVSLYLDGDSFLTMQEPGPDRTTHLSLQLESTDFEHPRWARSYYSLILDVQTWVATNPHLVMSGPTEYDLAVADLTGGLRPAPEMPGWRLADYALLTDWHDHGTLTLDDGSLTDGVDGFVEVFGIHEPVM